MSQKTILVTAANGNVGSSLAVLLLDQGFNVHALVRNTDSTTVRDLEKRGAKILYMAHLVNSHITKISSKLPKKLEPSLESI
jgi:GDP-D-mannose dehydratase